MTIPKEALEAAASTVWSGGTRDLPERVSHITKIITAYLAAAPQPDGTVAQEPVAWRWRYEDEDQWTLRTGKPPVFLDTIAEPLYASPPPAVAEEVGVKDSPLTLTLQMVEAAARAMDPEVFSDDPEEAHRAASPLIVERVRDRVREAARTALTAALSSPPSEPAPQVVDNEIARLRRNLERRDEYIVGQGLWDDFVSRLEASRD
ncbi:hypothetical protein [Rhizobium leucaenae]|uniref:hypothetical protein n=1 Tax=Rhizobium leucaenae TaxID=29450 RepID=UPI00161D38EA|nr:hypothetical protein [Rhizobium leucaenae]MBB6299962.1 hypothetical protein [Rhizobium leucaenae]